MLPASFSVRKIGFSELENEPNFGVLEIKLVNLSELEASAGFQEMLAEGYIEAKIDDVPFPLLQMDMYHTFEDNGTLTTWGAYCDGIVVGFLMVLNVVLPHYGRRFAVVENYLVIKDYRKTGAGLKLRYEAEKFAKEIDAVGLIIGAVPGSASEKILEGSSEYKKTKHIYFRKTQDV